jgi:hypothetical protein
LHFSEFSLINSGMATFPEYRIESVESLIPSIQNARIHSDQQIDQIVASIKEFGFTNPILVDGAKGVVAGHGRLLAAQRLAMIQVPVVELSHLTPEQKRAYMLADNRLALAAGWDEDILRLEISALREVGFNVELTGFDERELDQLFAADADPSSLWQGMPEFNQPDAFAYRSIVVHFKDAAGVDEFKKAINQPQITDVTKFIWFPPVPEESYMNRHYVTEQAASDAKGSAVDIPATVICPYCNTEVPTDEPLHDCIGDRQPDGVNQ